MAFQKKVSDYDPVAKDQGYDYVAAAGKPGLGIAAWSYTSDGTPDALTFAAAGYPQMADATYQVFIGGEVTTLSKVDESTKTTLGFSVIGTANGEVIHVLVIGRFASMPAA